MNDEDLRVQGPPLKYDNTMRVMFNQCPRKFYWFNRRMDYENSIKPPYFTFGIAWGMLQGLWYATEGPYMPVDEPLRKVLAGKILGTVLEWWDSQGVAENGADTRTGLGNLFSLYIDEYTDEPFRLVPGGAEKGWLWPLAGTKYFLGGSLDMHIEWPGYGVMPKEDKTTGTYLNDSFLAGYAFDSQITQYIWYYRQLLGEKVWGCLVNVAAKRITKAGKTPQFSRVLETRTELQLAEFEQDWLHDIKRVELAWDQWHWPKTTDKINCVGGIGKAPCLFRRVCLSSIPFTKVDPSQFPGIIERQDLWEPWAREDPISQLQENLGERTEHAKQFQAQDQTQNQEEPWTLNDVVIGGR